MAKPLDIVAAAYPDREHADTILNMLQQMHRASTITLADAALITKDQQGKIKVEETREVTTRKGARRGALIAGCLGIIYPPSLIASVLVGGGIGAFLGKLRDTGIKSRDMKEIAGSMTPGELVVITLSEPQSTPAIARAMQGWDARFLRGGEYADASQGSVQAAASQATVSDQPATTGQPEQTGQAGTSDGASGDDSSRSAQ
jgi:uncharacterized membrane protein